MPSGMTLRPFPSAALLAALLLIAACSPTPENTPAGTTAAPPATTPAGPSVATPLVARVVAAPIPVPLTDGKVHLAYELQLTNTLAQDLTLTSVDVRSGDRTLLSLPGDRLDYWTRIIGSTSPTTTIGPAQTAFVWLDVALDPDQVVPDQLTHAIGVPPPLTGRNWLDLNGCCGMTSHRMALNPINGELWAAERFAIDYLQLGPDGRVFTGEMTDVASYQFFGADILAVGDGPVVSTRDDLPEQVPGTLPTGLALDEYGGNHIVQDLGGGNFAFYAHLKTGGVKVQPGDQLTAGQVIGALGNSGNTDAPHLHFHIMNTPDPLRSDGLPFVFSSFQLDSRLADTAQDLPDGGPLPLEPGFVPRDEKNTGPMLDDVMTYADR